MYSIEHATITPTTKVAVFTAALPSHVERGRLSICGHAKAASRNLESKNLEHGREEAEPRRSPQLSGLTRLAASQRGVKEQKTQFPISAPGGR